MIEWNVEARGRDNEKVAKEKKEGKNLFTS